MTNDEVERILTHELVTIPMAMAILGVKNPSIQWMIEKGRLEVVDMTVSAKNKSYLVRTASIRKVLAERELALT